LVASREFDLVYSSQAQNLNSNKSANNLASSIAVSHSGAAVASVRSVDVSPQP